MAEERRREYEKEPAAGSDGERKSLKEIISDITEQELSGSSDDIVTVEQLKSMEKECSSRLKRRRLIGAAAVFFVVIAGALIVSVNYPADVEADKNAPEEIVSEDGVVIEDGGWGSSSEDTLVITDWDEVANAKIYVNELMIPEYIPKEYNFEKLIIEQSDLSYVKCTFTFTAKDNSNSYFEIIELLQNESSNSVEIEDIDSAVKCEKGNVYIKDSEEIKIATIQIDGGKIIEIRSDFDNNDIIMLINNIN